MKLKSSVIKWFKHILSLVVGFAIFGFLIYYNHFEGLARLQMLDYGPAFGALIATLVMTVAISIRWGILANALSNRRLASWIDYYYYFIISHLFGFFLPKDLTDFGIRIYWLRKNHDLSLPLSSFSVVLDRFFDLLLIFIFFCSVVTYWLGWVQPLTGVLLMLFTALMTGSILFFFHLKLLKFSENSINALLNKINYISWVKQRLPGSLKIPDFDRKTIILVYCFSLMKFSFTAFRFVLFSFALGLSISPWLFILGTPIGQLGYLLSFTPGGLGGFEAGWFGILKLDGVTTEQALTFVVGQRVLSVLYVMLLAFIAHMTHLIRNVSLGKRAIKHI